MLFIKNFSLNSISSDTALEIHLRILANVALISLFQTMNQYTTVWDHSFVEHDEITVDTDTVTLEFDPIRIIEISDDNYNVWTRYSSLKMISNWNWERLKTEDQTTHKYSRKGKVITFHKPFKWRIFYVRMPNLISDENINEEVDFPIETLGSMFFLSLFNLMPFVLQEWQTIATGHYEHAKELFKQTVSSINNPVEWFSH